MTLAMNLAIRSIPYAPRAQITNNRLAANLAIFDEAEWQWGRFRAPFASRRRVSITNHQVPPIGLAVGDRKTVSKSAASDPRNPPSKHRQAIFTTDRTRSSPFTHPRPFHSTMTPPPQSDHPPAPTGTSGALRNIRTVAEILAYRVEDDPTAMLSIGGKILCGGAVVGIVAALAERHFHVAAQLGIHLANGTACGPVVGLKPLRVLIVSGEEDPTDAAEILQSLKEDSAVTTTAAVPYPPHMVFQRALSGMNFCEWLEEAIHQAQCDVLILAPMHSFCSGIGSRWELATFLRSRLGPVISHTGCIAFLVGLQDASSLERGVKYPVVETRKSREPTYPHPDELYFTYQGRLLAPQGV